MAPVAEVARQAAQPLIGRSPRQPLQIDVGRFERPLAVAQRPATVALSDLVEGRCFAGAPGADKTVTLRAAA